MPHSANSIGGLALYAQLCSIVSILKYTRSVLSISILSRNRFCSVDILYHLIVPNSKSKLVRFFLLEYLRFLSDLIC